MINYFLFSNAFGQYAHLKVYISLRLINIKGDIMVNLDKATEEKILEIVEKYQKEDTKLLNYLITDDVITFFSPLANGNAITAEDLQKVANILDGSFEGMEIVNQEYRFKFIGVSLFFFLFFSQRKRLSYFKCSFNILTIYLIKMHLNESFLSVF